MYKDTRIPNHYTKSNTEQIKLLIIFQNYGLVWELSVNRCKYILDEVIKCQLFKNRATI